MKSNTATPGLLLVTVVLLCAVLTVLTFAAAMSEPRIGLTLQPTSNGNGVAVSAVSWTARVGDPGIVPGSHLLAISPFRPASAGSAAPITLQANDVRPEPDSLQSYAALNTFLARQSMLATVLRHPRVALSLRNPVSGTAYSVIAYPKASPWWALPSGFWVQFLTGIAGLLIAGWVWALRPRAPGPIMFALSAIGLAMATTTSAIYANRELAIDGANFAALLPINHIGTLMFGLALVGLFLCYPLRLVRPGWLVLLPLLLVIGMVLDLGELGAGPSQFYLWVALETAAIFIAIGAQWWATRHRPSDRAALGWIGLSVIAGAGSYTLLGAAPVVLHFPFGMPQSHVTGVLVVIYIGLALGLQRYRLFELGRWAYRVLFFTIGTLLLLAVDGLLVITLDLDSAPAFGLALVAIGFFYLPLRDWLWHRLTNTRHIQDHQLFAAAIDVAFAPSRSDSAARWRALLLALFDPLELAEAPPETSQPSIGDDGLTLLLPAIAGASALRLTFPFAGRGLFAPEHLQLANQLVTLTEHAEAGRAAYTRGVGEERRRMARDLHDDVSARLLSGLHVADAATRPMLQAALSDIRAIVSGLAGDEANLDRVLAETRHETARRLEAVGIALDWPVSDSPGETVLLDYRLHKALTSAVREIVSNVIRHAGASHLTVALELTADRLVLQFSDDGSGLPAPALAG
ncbi:MAG TPA: ATP-binding protein, partial [Devosia sp.]|nr:ATP-binding protein [Devosia sp.]